MKKYYIIYTCILISSLAGLVVSAQDTDSFPVPKNNPGQLFYLQRTPNTNTIVCELNYKNGVLDKDDPVHVFWIRYGEQGQKAELNFIQRNFPYRVLMVSFPR